MSSAAHAPEADPVRHDYTKPSRVCDVVMKGGVTSGVVYPWAVCELAQTYRFRNVGGTSAGAIAAAATAAAELGRQSEGGGFRRFAQLPHWLGAERNLFDLFQPQRRTTALYRTLTAGIGRTNVLWRILGAALWHFAPWTLLGAIPGLVLFALAVMDSGFRILWGAVSMMLLLAGGLLGSLYGVFRSTAKDLPANRFGLCSGFGETKPGRAPPLISWLADELDSLAGKAPGGPSPLTFGELWRSGGTQEPSEERVINLEMMTTNLNHGRPYRLPFDSRIWFFDPQEFRELFPGRVVRWMEMHPPAPPEAAAERLEWEWQCKLLSPLRPFPDAENLPVVVATRMSLSFPFLISAIPLSAIDWTRKANQQAEEDWRKWLRAHREDWPRLRDDQTAWEQVEKPKDRIEAATCWFSDGGVASNFPVHFFDAPIPRWPTFAINLGPFHPDHPWQPDDCQNIWLPRTNMGGIAETWAVLDARPGFGSLVAFGHAIVETMRNWMDNTQVRVPGFRDRIAHVRLKPDEGGLNLDMPRARISSLAERGRCAGAELARRFGPNPEETALTWDNHRWIRYRSTMALLEDFLSRFYKAYQTRPISPERTYEELVARDSETLPRSYPFESGQREAALEATRGLIQLFEQWRADGPTFGSDAPRPRPELRPRPRI